MLTHVLFDAISNHNSNLLLLQFVISARLQSWQFGPYYCFTLCMFVFHMSMQHVSERIILSFGVPFFSLPKKVQADSHISRSRLHKCLASMGGVISKSLNLKWYIRQYLLYVIMLS